MIKKIRIILIVFIFHTGNITNLLCDQNYKIDSLLKELNKWEKKSGYVADTMLYIINYKLGLQLRNSKPDTAIYYFKKSLHFAKKIKNQLKIIESMAELARCYNLLGDFEKALSESEQALKQFPKKTNKKNKIKMQKLYTYIIRIIGLTYTSIGSYQKALDYYYEAQKIDKKIGNKQGQAANLGNIGLIYDLQGDYNKALEYYLKAL